MSWISFPGGGGTVVPSVDGTLTKVPRLIGGTNANITPSGTAHTKGSWQELIASTSEIYTGIMVIITSFGSGGVFYLLDIGVGSAGNESVLIPNITGGRSHSDATGIATPMYLPLNIPAGSRLSARLQASTTTNNGVYLEVYGCVGDVTSYSGVEVLGVDDSGATTSTQVDPGTPLGNKGAWASLGQTTADYKAAALMFTRFEVSGSVQEWWVDIAFGSPGSEEIVINDVHVGTIWEGLAVPQFVYLPFEVPSGTTVSARCLADTQTTPDRYLYAGILGAHTAVPATTAAPTSAPPTTLAPTTAGSTTLAPTTSPPTTLAPTTLAPTTAAPAPLYDVSGMESLGSPVTLTTGISHTKGSYVEVVASTSREYQALIIDLMRPSDADVYFVDIAFGAAASEVVKIANLFAGIGTSAFRSGSKLFIPLNVPSGTRVAARAQGRQATNSINCEIMGMWGTMDSFSTITTLGANTGNTTGISVDPGASANTKGSWVEVDASLAVEPYWVGLTTSWDQNTSRSNCRWAVDLGTGAAAAETAVWGDMSFFSHTSTDAVYPMTVGMHPLHINSGTRLSMRAECDITDATDRLLEFAVHVASGIV